MSCPSFNEGVWKSSGFLPLLWAGQACRRMLLGNMRSFYAVLQLEVLCVVCNAVMTVTLVFRVNAETHLS